MIIQYSSNLGKQEFFENAEILKQIVNLPQNLSGYIPLGEIENPHVALDRKRLSNLKNGDLILHLFGHPQVAVGTAYDGIVAYWTKLDGTWPATIDSITHLIGQSKLYPLDLSDKKVLDFGCGTGIIGKHFSSKNVPIGQLHYTDINPNCVKTTKENNVIGKGIVSNGFENIGEKYDYILAGAIPAMPVYPQMKREINPLFEGTSFLEEILRESPKHLNKNGKLIISCPSMAENIFLESAKKYGAKINELYSHEIAFREDFLQDENWAKYLIELGGLRLQEKEGHKYWFDAKVRELTYD
jgi:SAM-dependent methyltransferase